ncbi:hypothetical protein D9M68_873870 [compost metagenome]
MLQPPLPPILSAEMTRVDLTLASTDAPSSVVNCQLVPMRSASGSPSAVAGIDSRASVARLSKVRDNMVHLLIFRQAGRRLWRFSTILGPDLRIVRMERIKWRRKIARHGSPMVPLACRTHDTANREYA